MKQQIDLEVEQRETRGKNAARRLRQAGKVPAVVYGMGKDSEAVAVDVKTMTRLLLSPAGQNSVLNLRGTANKEAVLAADYQVDPVKNNLLHVDLRRIDVDKSLRVSVPISTIGVSYGVKTEGGFEEMINREVEVECLPLDIPDTIEIDITELKIGQSIHARDLPETDQYKIVSDESLLVLHVMAAKTAEADEEAEEEEGVEGEAVEGEEKKDDAE